MEHEKLSSENTRINSKSLPLGWNDFNMWWVRIFIHILQSKTPRSFMWPRFKLYGVRYLAMAHKILAIMDKFDSKSLGS